MFAESTKIIHYTLNRKRSASILKKMKSKMVKPNQDDPPELKNGKGIPITGISPNTMPKLMST